MLGIFGLITKMPRERAEEQLRRMAASVGAKRHDCGTWVDESLGVYVGWTALKDSVPDCTPIQNEQRDIVLFFAGEEFPDPHIVRDLQARGHQLAPGTSSHLVHLYEEQPSFPVTVNGRFHGLLTDRTRGSAMLFNDRFGMHRLYYHEAKEAFYFAAEAKAILAVCPPVRKIDLRGFGELVSCGCVLEDRSLFEGISLLPRGSAWTFRNGALERKSSYFDAREWEDQTILDPESYYRELSHVFSRNLPRYFEPREQVAMSLTGGLDTRMVMAWQDRPAGSLPCYTFGSSLRECQDVVIARRVARECEQPFHAITLGSGFFSRFHEYAERTVHLTDGCADVSRSPDLYVNEVAREIAPVRLTGNYGGEVLRRVRAFKPMDLLPGLFRPELLGHVRQARKTYADLLQCHPLSFAVFRQAPWHHYGLSALEQSQLRVRSPFLDNDFVRTVFRAPSSTLLNDAVCLRLIADGNGALRKMWTDRGPFGRDPVSSAARAAIEFMRKAEYAYDYGMPQWLARVDSLLSGLHLERLFLGRQKFFHFRLWYRDVLSGYVRDMLLDRRSLSRWYVEPAAVKALVNSHISGRGNHTVAIHKLLTLELVHRQLLDTASPMVNAA